LELLPRRELEEAFDDEPLRLELPERLLDDFVACAISSLSLSLPCEPRSCLRLFLSLLRYPCTTFTIAKLGDSAHLNDQDLARDRDRLLLLELRP
jgi:hypothetical protein